MIIESTSFASPMRKPSREPFSTCGAALMFSCPPQTTMSESPLAMDCAPSIAALRPEPQTLLMVIAGTMSGSPAQIAAWRAGFWPTAAVSTCPMITSETWSGDTPARSSAFLMMCAPSFVAGTPASEPPNLPIAERAAPTMTMSSMLFSWLCLACFLFDVATRCRLDRRICRAAGLCRGFARTALEPFQPLRPLRPPAAALFLRLRQPVVRIFRGVFRKPETALAARRRIDDPGDMPARAQHELLFAADQAQRTVARTPGDDLVFARGADAGRLFHLAEVHRDAAVLQRARHAPLVLGLG